MGFRTYPKPSREIAPTSLNATVRHAYGISSGSLGMELASGALTADVYSEILSITSAGWLRLAGVWSQDATLRYISLKINIDGNDVYDQISGGISSSGEGFFAVGHTYKQQASGYTPQSNVLEKFRFNKSLSISVKSSLTETNKVNFRYLLGLS